jgi:hypothetical protein
VALSDEYDVLARRERRPGYIPRGQSDDWKLSLYTPVIVKCRDAKTERGSELEEWLR